MGYVVNHIQLQMLLASRVVAMPTVLVHVHNYAVCKASVCIHQD